MAFSEKTKLDAKRKAYFCCVMCKEPFVEIHHIVPQAEGGSDELDNAAPLCASCHNRYGENPTKRKQIREMRDFWWEICENRTINQPLITLNVRLDEIYAEVIKTLNSQISQEKILSEIKDALNHYHSDSVTRLSSAQTLSQVAKASGLQLTGMVTDPDTGETGNPIYHDDRIIYI